MDPEVKRYFMKILNSFSVGLLWLFSLATAGFYFKLALVGKTWLWYNGLFYVLALLSLVLLIRYYFRLWRHPDFDQLP